MVDHPGFGCQAGEAAVEERDGDFDEADRYVEKRRLSCSELGYILVKKSFWHGYRTHIDETVELLVGDVVNMPACAPNQDHSNGNGKPSNSSTCPKYYGIIIQAPPQVFLEEPQGQTSRCYGHQKDY